MLVLQWILTTMSFTQFYVCMILIFYRSQIDWSRRSSFSELAKSYGEGPESKRNGIIGPLKCPMSIHLNFPLLRKLRPAEIHPPRKFGDWYVLLRLDHFSPARFDDSMRSFLNQQLESFLTKRRMYS